MRSSAYYSRNNSYSRSYRASVAESEGRLPLTRAIASLAESAMIRKATAKRLLSAYGSGEWHHVGKFASVVYYYDVPSVLHLLDCTARELAEERISGLIRPLVLEVRKNRSAERAYVAKNQLAQFRKLAKAEYELAAIADSRSIAIDASSYLFKVGSAKGLPFRKRAALVQEI